MKITILTLIVLAFNLTTNAQENNLFKELNKLKGADIKVSYIMELPVENMDVISLVEKVNSELKTIDSCIDAFINSKKLNLTEIEISILKKRTEKIALELYKSNNYVLLKDTSGYAPISGVGMEIISEKQVAIVYFGGGCTIDETDLKHAEITSIFNKKMKSLLNR